jgi:outer membrane protein OmpA-like peptidoglycan-associated protein
MGRRQRELFPHAAPAQRGGTMIQKELNAENKEIMKKAHELYVEHGFKDGNDFVDWLEAEKQTGRLHRFERHKRMRNILYTVVAILCVIVAILLMMLFRPATRMELSQKNLSDLKVMMLVLDPKTDEKVLVFGDTHFDYNKSALTNEARMLLDKDVQVLIKNPKTRVRMAGYTSAQGTKESNQTLSEERANAVRNYLVEKGIAPGRISTIGYGRTKPALYEVSPDEINTKEAKANMRVLFEVVVQ